MNVTTRKKSKSQIPVVIGFMLLMVPIYLLYLWFHAWNQTIGNDYLKNQELYNSYLPQFLKGRYGTTLFSLPFCFIAILINVRNINGPINRTTILPLIVVVLGAFLAFANLWSIM